MATLAELLAETPLFALLDEQERSSLAERTEHVHFDEGTTIFRGGEPGDSMYVVRAGEVEIFFKNDTGQRIVLETARAGDFFGEISLLDGGPRTASAVAKTNVEAIMVDRNDLDDFLRRSPAAAMDLLAATGRRLRETARLLRHTASRDVNEAEEDKRTRVMKVADWISEASGSIPFLLTHCVLFFLWIIDNVAPVSQTRWGGWDPYPFGLLTMAVSLEAIILSVFVLLSQNRQAARERLRNDVEYQVNLKAELEVAELHRNVADLQAELLARLDRIEKRLDRPSPRTLS
ncbi:MAG: DUF1003 domain-containing protein [Polyangiaceae bacterium]|jgi:uncharacterized membrane protein